MLSTWQISKVSHSRPSSSTHGSPQWNLPWRPNAGRPYGAAWTWWHHGTMATMATMAPPHMSVSLRSPWVQLLIRKVSEKMPGRSWRSWRPCTEFSENSSHIFGCTFVKFTIVKCKTVILYYIRLYFTIIWFTLIYTI